ncbi:MAG: hypothetical protein LBQ76_08535 [Candidatus Fibromonas sp.]|nr:hypothetical protein [Candidatus Fibromonas sp.]
MLLMAAAIALLATGCGENSLLEKEIDKMEYCSGSVFVADYATGTQRRNTYEDCLIFMRQEIQRMNRECSNNGGNS